MMVSKSQSKNNESPNNIYLFVDKFQVLRPLVQLLSHSCFHRKAGKKLLHQSSTYDKNLVYIRQGLYGYLRETKSKRKTVTHFPNNTYYQLDNQLARLFTLRTLSIQNMFVYIFIVFILGKSQNPLRVPEITQKWNDDICGKYTGNLPDSFYNPNLIIYRALDDLVKEGFVTKTGQKKEVRYTLTPDILSNLTAKEQQELYEAIRFYRNVAFLNVPGFYIQRLIKRRFLLQSRQLYQIRGNALTRIIDDEVLFQLGQAITHQQIITFTYQTSSTDMFSKKEQKHTGLPIRLRTNYTYARQYVDLREAKTNQKSNIYTYRLDRITNIHPANKDLQLREPIQGDTTNTSQKTPLPLVLTLYYTTPAEEVYIKTRIREHYPTVMIQRDSDTQSHCSIYEQDPRHILPWLRSLHPYVQIHPSQHHAVEEMRQRMITSIKEALKNYGTL